MHGPQTQRLKNDKKELHMYDTHNKLATVQCVLQVMITLKFSRNAKVTCALTGRSPVRPVADDEFGIMHTATRGTEIF